MAVDYDLVIVGGTLEAREAALSAASLGARVALVEPEPDLATPLQSSLYHQAFLQVGRRARQIRQNQLLGPSGQNSPAQTPVSLTLEWPAIFQWVEIVIANLADLRSPQIMATQGVDIIWGGGQFVRRPRLAFEVSDRLLTARAYILATGTHCITPPLNGPSNGRCFTLETCHQFSTLPHCPDRLVIIGATPSGAGVSPNFQPVGGADYRCDPS